MSEGSKGAPAAPNTPAALALPEGSRVGELARAFDAAGGRALVVGGWVRDALRGNRGEPRDIDLEVYGLAPDAVERVLAYFGGVVRAGRAFPVFLVKGLAVDVTLPRRDPLVRDESDPWAGFDPHLDFAEAARGRDLTVNAIAFDPLTREILDPHGGRADLAAGLLRAADPERFGVDALRGLRTCQLAARFEMDVEPALLALCAATDLSGVAPERVGEEFRKLLLRAPAPSRGLALLRETDLLRFFPELAALVGVLQEPEWHPEGDVWVHTLMVVDEAARLRTGDEASDLALMIAALCHDLGKPAVTEKREGRIVSRGHDKAGVEPTERFLSRLKASRALTRAVVALVRHHLAPSMFVRSPTDPAKPDATGRAYRRLARRLREAGIDFDLLHRLACADHFGRTTADAKARLFEAGDRFLERARDIDHGPTTHVDVVKGRHLLARGVEPGPEMGRLLAACRDVQEETGWIDPERILARVLDSEAEER